MFTQILTLAVTSVLATSGVAAEPIEQISHEDTASVATISYELSASESNDLTLDNGDILVMSDEETIQDDTQEKEGKQSSKEELSEMKQAIEDKVADMKADIETKLAEMKADIETKLTEMKAGLAEKAEAMKAELEEKKIELADKAENLKAGLADKADDMKQNHEDMDSSDIA